ncbi:hypothetical protein OEZ85_005521 [Tetradesmus obliquus]|uniref:SPRY domain-containing protein n=1 Tax=Tetradesmus obliquus TaxID=3088 RepID=A0ABY8UEI3_TETOB|nr:hypothetical protein OEZ85_005521 [Tetradesmus obliquus]
MAASCEYFEKMLIDFNPVQGGALGEQSAVADIKLQAPSAAVNHVLHFLHTGTFISLSPPTSDLENQQQYWLTLLETCSLAQLYMLPALQQHIADQLMQELPAHSLGLALSFALKAHLQLIVKDIWVALPRLLQQQPLHFDASFSAEAICLRHEAVLLQLLARLSWQLLPPAALERLEALALLSPGALLDIYRVHQRCSHLALWGSFPATTTVLRPGGSEAGRLRCYTAGGEQVLDCDSPAHITASANMWLSSGRHCWQVVLLAPCDLVWLGVGDGSLAPDVWGGKQAGGWFYGSNDALCHDRHSDKHAYDKHAGHGPWGAPDTVVDVCLDMDARELWFGVNGAQLKLGFTGLPARVQPAVSMRAPGQLLVRFRAASLLTAELVSSSSATSSSTAAAESVPAWRRETVG